MQGDGELSAGGVPWGLRDMALACLVALALVLAGLGAGALLLMVLGAGGRPAPSQELLVLGVFAVEAVLVLPAWLWGPGRYGGGWRSLGLRGFPLGRTLLLLIISLPVVLAVNYLWEMIRELIGLAGQPDYLPFFGEGLTGLAVALFLGAVIAPLAEEVFFRGYLYAGLRARWGVGISLAISSLLFAVVHGVPGVLPPIFVLGALFAYLYEHSGSIWPSIVLHATVNALAFISSYVMRYHPELLEEAAMLARAALLG